MPLKVATSVKKLKIVIVSAVYSEGMGYSENCLSKALAKLGHEVHVVTSIYNVYGNEPLYDATYREFLGPAKATAGTRVVDGYTVHRLDAGLLFGYVNIRGLNAKVRELAPDIVHSLEVASLQTYKLAGLRPFARFNLFTETHQTLSVMRPYMLHKDGQRLKRAVARRFYGVPASKLKLMSLGADADTFRPAETDEEREARAGLRGRLGYRADDIVCVYTGRFTPAKNPLALALAIDVLSRTDPRYQGLFIGDGEQRPGIAACRHTTIVPFMTHTGLAEHYRASDIGVWPRQESMSMLDAASTGIPLVVSEHIGESERVAGNGRVYRENSVEDLARVLSELADPGERAILGAAGRAKVLRSFSWDAIAKSLEADFVAAHRGRGRH
jgi:glycosyltransferase involved in cell wall biosynthesis